MVKMGPNGPIRRRVWYSLYILDQLVALQLSRPPAIRQGDFNVSLPARSDEVPILDQPGTITAVSEKDPWIGDYFVSMIHFSHVINQVLRSLYSPLGTRLNDETLSTIESLDRTLLEWKLSLPRSLRFDLGHTFEKSETSRRQVGRLTPSIRSCHADRCREICSPSNSTISALLFIAHFCLVRQT